MAQSPLSTTGRTSFRASVSYASRSPLANRSPSTFKRGGLMTYLAPFHLESLYRDSDEMLNDKNFVWDGLNVYYKGNCMSRRKKSQDMGAFLSHPGENWTKSFRSGMRVAKDRTFILTSRQKRVFYPLLRANQLLAPSIRTRSTVHSAQIGIHRIIRVHV